jgi:ATP-dependent Clp protease ATP-binding subunit ClpC
MSSTETEQLKILSCPICKSTGFVGWSKCRECKAMQMSRHARGRLLYWGYPLTRHFLALAKGRRILHKIQMITALAFLLVSWIWFGFLIYSHGLYVQFLNYPEYWLSAIKNFTAPMKFLFWLGILMIAYLWHKSIRQREYLGLVERYKYNYNEKAGEVEQNKEFANWLEAKKLKRKKRLNIATTFTQEAISAIGAGYHLADKSDHPQFRPLHLFYVLLDFNRVSNVFIRLGVSADTIKRRLSSLFEPDEKNKVVKHVEPEISPELKQILFQAYETAYQSHQEYVSVTELLEICVRVSEPIWNILYDLGIEKHRLANAVEWARIRERLYHQYVLFRRAASHRSKHGMDKAMTALATPYLNQFSDDLTLSAQYNHLDACVARETEMENIFRVVEGGQQNVILIGDHGVGKRTIVEGIAQKMVMDDVPDRLKDKRFVRLNISSLLAGTTAAGAVERLQRMMHEISRARNVILYIHNIHELVGVSAGTGKGSLDVADTLAEYMRSGRFLTIADTTNEYYSQLIANSAVINVFTKVDIAEMSEDQAIQVVESRVGGIEYKHQVFFSYDAVEKAVEFAHKFIHEIYLPGNALEIVSEAASMVRNKKGANHLVSSEDIAAIISEKTKIPVTTVSSDESSKLLRLEEEMHKRVVGQDEAVNSVANALRRSRAEIRSTKRPIANFLFLGPTGVGKTELAKTIAEVYFGGEERMIRLDMSEYQDKSGIYRLIGSPGEKGTGILTEAVRKSPFSLLLLDEIEKADPNILNIFLQVMDDGRLSDSVGHVVDFTNIIIIATSNAGTSFVAEQMRANVSYQEIKTKLLHGELKENFRPEFLNRFDGIVLFKSLTRADIKQVAGFMLKRVAKDLDAKGVELKVEETALEYLADVGFDPEFGARPMRRALQEKVENKLAELLLGGKLKRRDVVVIGEGGEIRVE